MDLDLEKIVKIYRVAQTANVVMDQKARLSRTLAFQKRSMNTVLGVADVTVRASQADLDGQDVRNAAKVAWRHGPRLYAYLAKKARQRAQNDE